MTQKKLFDWWAPERKIDSNGYARVRVMRGNRPFWQPEHRYVVEKTIGRDLLSGESVHHKNGDRSDNRIENLELWATAHGSGQRVSELAGDAIMNGQIEQPQGRVMMAMCHDHRNDDGEFIIDYLEATLIKDYVGCYWGLYDTWSNGQRWFPLGKDLYRRIYAPPKHAPWPRPGFEYGPLFTRYELKR